MRAEDVGVGSASSTSIAKAGENADGSDVVAIVAVFADDHVVADGVQSRARQHDVALLGQVFGVGQLVDEAAGEHIHQLDRGVPDGEAPRISDGNSHLDGEHDLGAVRCADGTHRRHRALDRQSARGATSAIVAVEPAGDGIPAEVDDLAAIPIDVVDHRMEHAVQMGGQFLGASLRAQLVGEGLGERRESRHVGEQGAAPYTVNQLTTFTERSPAITGQVRVRSVDVRVADPHRQLPMMLTPRSVSKLFSFTRSPVVKAFNADNCSSA